VALLDDADETLSTASIGPKEFDALLAPEGSLVTKSAAALVRKSTVVAPAEAGEEEDIYDDDDEYIEDIVNPVESKVDATVPVLAPAPVIPTPTPLSAPTSDLVPEPTPVFVPPSFPAPALTSVPTSVPAPAHPAAPVPAIVPVVKAAMVLELASTVIVAPTVPSADYPSMAIYPSTVTEKVSAPDTIVNMAEKLVDPAVDKTPVEAKDVKVPEVAKPTVEKVADLEATLGKVVDSEAKADEVPTEKERKGDDEVAVTDHGVVPVAAASKGELEAVGDDFEL
jgi:hypothetical protein